MPSVLPLHTHAPRALASGSGFLCKTSLSEAAHMPPSTLCGFASSCLSPSAPYPAKSGCTQLTLPLATSTTPASRGWRPAMVQVKGQESRRPPAPTQMHILFSKGPACRLRPWRHGCAHLRAGTTRPPGRASPKKGSLGERLTFPTCPDLLANRLVAGVAHRPPRVWSWDSEGKNSQVILLSSSWHFHLKKNSESHSKCPVLAKSSGKLRLETGCVVRSPSVEFPKLLPKKLRMGLLDTRARARARGGEPSARSAPGLSGARPARRSGARP